MSDENTQKKGQKKEKMGAEAALCMIVCALGLLLRTVGRGGVLFRAPPGALVLPRRSDGLLGATHPISIQEV